MTMQSIQATKHRIVSNILAQRTYTPSSGVWCRLYNQLMKMSKDDLSALEMVISIKVSDCAGENLVDLVEEVTQS